MHILDLELTTVQTSAVAKMDGVVENPNFQHLKIKVTVPFCMTAHGSNLESIRKANRTFLKRCIHFYKSQWALKWKISVITNCVTT